MALPFLGYFRPFKALWLLQESVFFSFVSTVHLIFLVQFTKQHYATGVCDGVQGFL
jgi:hypothetical protein